jgi:hypothetical protein
MDAARSGRLFISMPCLRSTSAAAYAVASLDMSRDDRRRERPAALDGSTAAPRTGCAIEQPQQLVPAVHADEQPEETVVFRDPADVTAKCRDQPHRRLALMQDSAARTTRSAMALGTAALSPLTRWKRCRHGDV